MGIVIPNNFGAEMSERSNVVAPLLYEHNTELANYLS